MTFLRHFSFSSKHSNSSHTSDSSLSLSLSPAISRSPTNEFSILVDRKIIPADGSNHEFQLYSIEYVPEFLQRPFIYTGYRIGFSYKNSLKSIFYFHNETFNIYTHLVSMIFFIYLYLQWNINYSLLSNFNDNKNLENSSNNENNSNTFSLEYYSIQFYFISSIFCFFSSVCFHLWNSHSELIHQKFYCVDLFGIGILLFFSFLPGFLLGFYCRPQWKLFYSSIIFIGILFYFLFMIIEQWNYKNIISLWKIKKNKKKNFNFFIRGWNLLRNLFGWNCKKYKNEENNLVNESDEDQINHHHNHENNNNNNNNNHNHPISNTNSSSHSSNEKCCCSSSSSHSLLHRLRMIILISLCTFSLIPIFHFTQIFSFDFPEPQEFEIFNWFEYSPFGLFSILFPLGLQLLFYLIGFLFYYTRFPESKYPGRFDYYFHSHTIWHCFVSFGCYSWYCGLTHFYSAILPNAICLENSNRYID